MKFVNCRTCQHCSDWIPSGMYKGLHINNERFAEASIGLPTFEYSRCLCKLTPGRVRKNTQWCSLYLLKPIKNIWSSYDKGAV